MTTDTMEGVADERDTSAVDRLDREFEDQRIKDHAAVIAAKDAETEAERVAAQAKADVERSAARAVLVKRAGVASLLLGAGIAIACFGASFLLPGHERVVTRDVPGPERRVEVPVYVTKQQKDFIDRPDYQSADFHGKLVADPDGFIRFDNGKIFRPIMSAEDNTVDPTQEYVTAPYYGDYAYCNKIPNQTYGYRCLAIHDDVIVDLNQTRRTRVKADAIDPSKVTP